MTLPATGSGGQGEAYELAVEELRAGQPERALRRVDDALAEMPDDLRLRRWELDFGDTTVHAVRIGKRSIYLVTRSSNVSGQLVIEDHRPLINDTTSRFDFASTITCLDALTGRPRWTRRTAGWFESAIDPRTDGLLLWRHSISRWTNKVYRLSPVDGRIDLEVNRPLEARPLDGLVMGGEVVVPRLRVLLEKEPAVHARVLDIAAGKLAWFGVADLGLASPDGRARLVIDQQRQRQISAVGVSLLSSTDGSRLWRKEIPGRGVHPPVWLADSVVVAVGRHDNRAVVVSLDLQSGSRNWTFVLPRGVHLPGMGQLADGSYPPADWVPVQRFQELLLVTGAEGTLYFLRAGDGELVSTLKPFGRYLTAPGVVGDTLVLSSPRAIRAIPVQAVRASRRPDEGSFRLLRARCLAALDRTEEALREVRLLGQLTPLRSEAWAVRGELSGKLGMPWEEIYALTRHLALTQTVSSPELRAKYGLERRIPTGANLATNLLLVGEDVMAGTSSGSWYRIDARTLEIVDRRAHQFPIHGLEAQILGTGIGVGGPQPVWNTSDPVGPVTAPVEWGSYSGLDGPPVQYRSRYFRPLSGGAVRILEGDSLETVPAAIEGIKTWAIHIGPGGPLGYGTGGVYRLDADLRPVERLIDIGHDERSGERWAVLLFSATGSSMALVFGHHRRAVLQIWSADGGALVREVPIGAVGDVRGERNRLRPLGDGYLLSTEELLWVSTSRDVVPWRFGFADVPGVVPLRQRVSLKQRFGVPVVANGRAFVACRDGGIYVFRIADITG